MAQSIEICLSKNQLKKHLTCPVCKDIFKDPYQLPCGHSLCMECLKRMLERRPPAHRWQPFCCPTCRHDHDLPIGVRKSYTLRSIVEDYNNYHKDEKQNQWVQATQTLEVSRPVHYFNYNNVLYNLLQGVIFICILYVYACSTDIHTLSGKAQRQQTLLSMYKPDLPDLTFNKDTANPFLHVSDDLLTVRRLKNPQYYPPHPSRFTEDPQVLSTQCASHGRHYWELEAEGSWDIAVAYKTITKTLSAFGTNKQSWSLRHDSKGRLFAYHAGERQRIHKSLTHNRIGVVVDFFEGEILFKEMGTTYNHLYTFKVNLNQPVCLGLGLFWPSLNTTISVKKTFSG
ncbi:E3 ubiquitin/ISG15 ligase TRIM25-like [Engraulis encrasicolus]|uniref:E3 ubiquitin/ISG15 ligase TRIM25-like n=1 Tax=Engraulis encrasicolus TaxID=184585 RepID=UPI002FCED867